MASTRMLIVRGSLLLNALLVLYLCVSWFSTSPTRHTALATHSLRTPSPLDVHHVDFEGIDTAEMVGGNGVSQDAVPLEVPLPAALASDLGDSEMRDISLGGRRTLGQLPEQSLQAGVKQLLPGALEQVVQAGVEQMPLNKGVEQSLHGGVDASAGEQEEPPREVQESAGVTEQLLEPLAIEPPDPPLDSLERKIYPDLRECSTRPQRPFYFQRGDYWVLENYIPAALSFRCDESITYTTHADYTFLDNLEPLTSRWQGPVSVAVYAPGDDFNATINTILYLRDCWAEGIKKYVTFHLFFHVSHKPKKVPSSEELLKRKTDCALEPPRWTNVTTYRQHKKLLYPVNIARNTARQAVQTYFVFPSDVELYPSINFIPEFFKMLKQPDVSNTTNPRVFVFSIFEVKENVSAPETKSELQKMLTKKDAIPFHKNVCAKCHNVPMSKEWIAAPVKPGMSVFHIGKRKPPFHKWEPIYIGTNREPLYDERLSWEGKSDKMTQMYILCVRDYEFHILDNAFLVHKPGIKKIHKDPFRDRIVAKQNSAISSKIFPEYKTIFGFRKSCVI
nr:beta-1,4-glucuronyltransferase 1-like isoform X2 [Cherax quadricarinatus]XP_053633267.1 beta-1,4-glucuronyltransferase 1-like isoform X2 [Cherax quadricarinatus]